MALTSPLAPGTEVVVRTLGRKRGIIVVQGRGRYQVRVENLTVWCGPDDLAVPEGSRRTRARAGRGPAAAFGPPAPDDVPPGRVDLHGLTVEDAIARVTAEIDRTLRRGADRLEVVHGKGSGRIRTALHRFLSAAPFVAAFRLDSRNPGITWIYFR